jgi:hypothetical protein
LIYRKHGEPYSTSEDYRILVLLRRGLPPIQIARILGGGTRSVAAVRTRTVFLKKTNHIEIDVGETVQIIPEKIISKSDLPVWYELGWSVGSFEDDTCTLKWLHGKRVPRTPDGGQNVSHACSYPMQPTGLHGESSHQLGPV